jgi:hypothetical protein
MDVNFLHSRVITQDVPLHLLEMPDGSGGTHLIKAIKMTPIMFNELTNWREKMPFVFFIDILPYLSSLV